MLEFLTTTQGLRKLVKDAAKDAGLYESDFSFKAEVTLPGGIVDCRDVEFVSCEANFFW